MKSLNLKGRREDKKILRNKKVNGLTVEVVRDNGTVLLFDGNEYSQQRMALYAQRMHANGWKSLPWVLANNTVVEVTADELERAVDEALIKQAEMWIL